MNTENLAIKLLQWNEKYLVNNSELTINIIKECFAEHFIVKANERSYDANLETYLEFLNGFKKDISSISYDIQEFLSSEDRVFFPLKAKILRLNGEMEFFQAMMYLKYNSDKKIIWWQEVYVKIR